MIKDEKVRFRLLFGPYDPPRTRRGKFLFCEWRGTVKVGEYSDGPIPWPLKWGTRRSLILCGDLVEAVKQESEVAVAHHWGVSAATVKKWRQALEVEFYNAGTRWLQHAQALENATPSRMRRITDLARAVTRVPKPRKWKRYMSQLVRMRIARSGPINPRHKLWTDCEDHLLGSKSDAELAAILGRSAGAIRSRRRALKIDLRDSQFKLWTRAQERLLGTKSDAEIAAMLGRAERGVQLHRQSLGIPCHQTSAARRPWTAKEDRLLGRLPDREVARRIGRSLATVQHRRHIKGIANPAPLRLAWTPEQDELLRTASEEEAAQLLGRSLHAIAHRRHFKGIPNPARERKFWKPEEMRLLGTRPDADIADLLGCTVRSVTTKRVSLGIRAPDRQAEDAWTDFRRNREERIHAGRIATRPAVGRTGAGLAVTLVKMTRRSASRGKQVADTQRDGRRMSGPVP